MPSASGCLPGSATSFGFVVLDNKEPDPEGTETSGSGVCGGAGRSLALFPSARKWEITDIAVRDNL